MPANTVTKGSCLCGSTTYTFTGSPAYTSRCHCLDCRKLTSGTNSVVFLIPRSDLTYSPTSALKQTKKTHHSGDLELVVNFCGNCGTAMHKESEAFGPMAIVFMGTVDDGGEMLAQAPQAEIWTKYRVGWNGEVKGARQCEGWDPSLA